MKFLVCEDSQAAGEGAFYLKVGVGGGEFSALLYSTP